MNSIYSRENRLIARRLRLARTKMGLTQKEAAKRLNTSQSFVSKLERSLVRIDFSHVLRFSKLYKKSFRYFLRGLENISLNKDEPGVG